MRKHTVAKRSGKRTKSLVGTEKKSLVGTKSLVAKSKSAEAPKEIAKSDNDVSTTVPSWISDLIDEEAMKRGMSKANIMRSWMYDYASEKFPDRVPSFAG